MYHPTSRVLTVLELIQSRPSITGPELAERLEMDVRTVRRYITHLQDIEGALAKVSRVLPLRARERLEAVTSHLVLFPHNQQARPDASLLIDLSGAIHASQRIEIDYRSLHNEVTHRKVEPYGITGWKGHWYLGGYCCLRQDYRSFRLDRIQQVQILSETFEKAENFDFEAYVKEQYNTAGMHMEVEFQGELSAVQQKIPTLYGTLTETPTGVLLQEQYDDVESMARYLMSLNLPFVIHHPPELREALLRLGERMVQLATAQ